MIILKYLTKEVVTTLAALTMVLMCVFLSNEFVRYLHFATSGGLPGTFFLRLMLLEIPALLGLVLPLGLFMGILVAYGRLYADSEMTALTACGMSQTRLISYTMILSTVVAILTGIMVMWVGPYIMHERNHILGLARSDTLLKVIQPQQFQSTNTGKQVFYVHEVDSETGYAKQLFIANKTKMKGMADPQKQPSPEMSDNWDIVTADQAQLQHDDTTDEDYAMLSNGQQYVGTPGNPDFRILRFEKFYIRLPQPKPLMNKMERAMPTSDLLLRNNLTLSEQAELHWRIAVPIMAMVLGLLAVPLSYVKPRQGKYAKLLPAVIVFMIYANMLFVARRWLAEGSVPAWLGLWWLHGMMIMFALALLVYPSLKNHLRYQKRAA